MTDYEKFTKSVGLMEKGISYERWVGLYSSRVEAIKKYGFAILTEKVIQKLKAYAPVLEVGAGTGYWAYEFQKRCVDYVATDPKPCCVDYFRGSKPWTNIEPLSAKESIERHPGRSLLLCWPSYGKSWASEALEAYGGDTVIYVGEGEGGCTADDIFHSILCDKWDTVDRVLLPQWPGIHDIVEVFRRKPV